ncbi:arad-like aldolase/epimerase [Schizophyllum commune Loenen D]|nr:arad-like aldolase/epimerase [Schizophyllum commune Loenen D]
MAPTATAPNGTDSATTKSGQNVRNLKKDPIDRTWRGDTAGTITMDQRIPKFDDPYEEREWIKEHLAGALRYMGKKGYGEGVTGHITVKDSVLPDHYWMNPFGVHFSSVTKSKLVLVSPDGYVTEHGAQYPINIAGFFIHSSIHKARPDARAIAHCHTIHGKAWSVFGRPVEPLTQDACVFYENNSVYPNFGGVVFAREEGENIAKALGPKHRTCILQNHGLLTIGDTVDEAVFTFGVLERVCQVQLLAEAAAANGIPKTLIGKEEAEFTASTFQDKDLLFQPDYELLMEETNGRFLA